MPATARLRLLARLGGFSLLGLAAFLGAGPVRAAPAAEHAAISLFEHAGFGGRRLDVTGAASPGLGRFNDRASSVEVRRGRWQLCTDADYAGQCMVLGPGRHGLEGPFHDGISSLRRVVGPNDEPLPPGPAIVLYEHIELQGRALIVRGPTRLVEGFNDQASSVDVIEGPWQLCTDADYRGECLVLGPGVHRLEGSFHDRVSSVRPAPQAAASPAPTPTPAPAPGTAPAGARVTLFDDPMGQGRALAVDGAVDDLARLQFNDLSSSVLITQGRWQLCSDASYRGTCILLEPGRHNIPKALNDRLSSLRPMADGANAPTAAAAPAAPPAQAGVTLFEGPDGNGRSLKITRPTAYTQDGQLRPASAVVHGGRWELCDAPGFEGRCVTLPAGRHSLRGVLDQVASARPR